MRHGTYRVSSGELRAGREAGAVVLSWFGESTRIITYTVSVPVVAYMPKEFKEVHRRGVDFISST